MTEDIDLVFVDVYSSSKTMSLEATQIQSASRHHIVGGNRNNIVLFTEIGMW